jgi:hypothetical protein
MAFRWCYDRGVRVTWQSAAHALSEMGYIDRVDGLLAGISVEEYLVTLQAETWAAAGCTAHARMVREYAERRNVVRPARREITL